jgi:hypothetical protein
MLANAIAIAVAAFALFTISANAQDIHPKCVKLVRGTDRAYCSCFITSGGFFVYSPGRGKNRAVVATMGQFDAHIACMKRYGYVYNGTQWTRQ